MSRIPLSDALALLLLLLAGLVFLVTLYLTKPPAGAVRVSAGGKEVAVFSLAEERTYQIETADGGENLLVIADGKASMTAANCPDGLCVRMGTISREGQSIVCLPHQVIVEVLDDTSGDVDAVTS